MNDIPAAACRACGGWTPVGGMSQHSESTLRAHGRTGCLCWIKHVVIYDGRREFEPWVVLKYGQIINSFPTGYRAYEFVCSMELDAADEQFVCSIEK